MTTPVPNKPSYSSLQHKCGIIWALPEIHGVIKSSCTDSLKHHADSTLSSWNQDNARVCDTVDAKRQEQRNSSTMTDPRREISSMEGVFKLAMRIMPSAPPQ